MNQHFPQNKSRFLKTKDAEYEREEWGADQVAPIRPIGDHVVVVPDKVKEKTSGGVYLPGTSQDVLNTGATSGVIAAMGEDAFRWNTAGKENTDRPKVGDHVFFTRYAGQAYVLNEQTFYVMTDRSIGGIEVG